MSKTIQRRSVSNSAGEQLNHLPPVLQRVFSARQVKSAHDIDYKISNLMPPSGMKGLDEAVALLSQAVRNQSKVLIVGDFDADGATSSALAVAALKAMGLTDVDYLVPNRFDYGYGLTPEIVAVAKEFAPDIIVTVDNGISSVAGVAKARDLGIPVIVTDHHLPGRELPDAAAMVNPNQPGCEFGTKNLAGVGVIFYVLVALRSNLRELQWFEQQGMPLPNMGDYLDLVALGTVADLVPLDTNNRILVYQGLNRIRSGRARPGISALLEVAGRQAGRLTAADLGFILGPRLNAAGRLDDMSLGIRCLLTDDPLMATELAGSLNDLNQDRRAIEASMQREAMSELAKLDFDSTGAAPWGVSLYQPQWHQGVVGIIASRIKERFHRPVIAFADADEGSQIKGSARSIPGLHIRDTLDIVATGNPGLITKFGGHAMAAGLSIQRQDYPAFAEQFDQAVRQQLSIDQLEEVILTDGALQPAELNLELAEAIRNAGPWGQTFPEPLFDDEFVLISQRIVGAKHLKLVVAPRSNHNFTLDAIAFGVDLDAWPNEQISLVHLVYQLEVNDYRGQRSVQLLVRHLWAIE